MDEYHIIERLKIHAYAVACRVSISCLESGYRPPVLQILHESPSIPTIFTMEYAEYRRGPNIRERYFSSTILIVRTTPSARRTAKYIPVGTGRPAASLPAHTAS